MGGAVSVIRISGPDSLAVFKKVSVQSLESEPRKLIKTMLTNPASHAVLDEVLAVYFPKGSSFTGEEVVELQGHGGAFGSARTLECVLNLGVRQALPGEFSFRAVRNGKMSLTQAEAVAELIQASNDQAVELALDKLQGLQHEQMMVLSTEIKNLTARSELGIDFSDQDVEELSLPQLKKGAALVLKKIEEIKSTYRRGKSIQEGIRIAFFGLPNAGKSSLFNALIGEDRSIVTQIPGTTRDIVHEVLTLRSAAGKSITLRLEDTAGLRKTHDLVEKMGMDRTLRAAKEADLVFVMADASQAEQIEELSTYWEQSAVVQKRAIGILHKVDLLDLKKQKEMTEILKEKFGISSWISVSSLKLTGVNELVDVVFERCEEETRRKPKEILITRLDHLQALQAAEQDLARATQATEEDLFAADIRQTLHSLEPILGKTSTDDILGKIFSEFCIGK